MHLQTGIEASFLPPEEDTEPLSKKIPEFDLEQEKKSVVWKGNEYTLISRDKLKLSSLNPCQISKIISCIFLIFAEIALFYFLAIQIGSLVLYHDVDNFATSRNRADTYAAEPALGSLLLALFFFVIYGAYKGSKYLKRKCEL